MGWLKRYGALIGIVLAAECIVAVVVYAMVMKMRQPDAQPGAEDQVIVIQLEDTTARVVYDKFEPLVFNPAGAGDIRTGVAYLDFLVDSEATSEEIGLVKVQFRDAMLGVLSHKYIHELEGDKNIIRLKEQFKVAANDVIRKGEVVEVCIRTLLIQQHY